MAFKAPFQRHDAMNPKTFPAFAPGKKWDCFYFDVSATPLSFTVARLGNREGAEIRTSSFYSVSVSYTHLTLPTKA